MIYVVRTKNAYPSFIKVGYTERIAERIKQLQTGCPFVLELIKKIPGNLEDEKRLHELLLPFGTTGEWFRDCDETMKILGITNARPIKAKKTKSKFYLSDTHRALNKEFRPRDFFGFRKRCSFELMQFCSQKKFLPRDVMEFPLRHRNYLIVRLTHDEACLKHNFLGDKFDGIGNVLIPKLGHRHNRRKALEIEYCSPVTPCEPAMSKAL